MAIGDDAVAAGLPLVNGATTQAKDIDDEINRTRDHVAQERAARLVQAATKVDKPSDGALMARQEPGSVHTTGFYTNSASGLFFRPVSTTSVYDRLVITQSELGTALQNINLSGYATQSGLNGVYDGNLSSAVYGRALSGSYRVAYVNSSGTLGWVSSSRSAKEAIETATIDVQAVIAMDVVTYHRIGADDGQIEHGLIAEDLHELGLTWLVDYGPEGDTPQGVRYDLLSLALIPAVKAAHADVAALTQRVAAIESHLGAVGGESDAEAG